MVTPSLTRSPSGSDRIFINELDEIFPYVEELGRFQVGLMSLLGLLILVGGYPDLIMYFAGHNPPWRCTYNSTYCKLNGTFSKSDARYKDRCTMPRTAWEFTKPREYSIVTTFDLYCDTEGLTYLTTSLLFIGWIIGAIVLGWLADRYGRWKVLFTSTTALLVVGFASAFSPNLTAFAISRFIVGFFRPGLVLGAFVMAGELVGPRWRPLSGNILWVIFSVALVLVGIKAYFVREWKTLFIICTAPYSVVLFFFFFIPESVRWLRINGHNDKAMAIMRKVAKVNKRELPDGIEFVPMAELGKRMSRASWKDIFWPKKMLIKSLIQGYSWCVIAMVYYGLSFAQGDLGGSRYRDFILGSLIEIPAALFTIYSQKRFGRKRTVITATIIGSIALIIVSPIPANGENYWKILRVILGMIGKFCITMSFNGSYLWSLELYPTSARVQGMGFLQITSRIGSAAAPWVAKWFILFHVVLPFSLMGATALMAAFLLLNLPETKDKPTLETLDDIDKELRDKNGIFEENHEKGSDEDNTEL